MNNSRNASRGVHTAGGRLWCSREASTEVSGSWSEARGLKGDWHTKTRTLVLVVTLKWAEHCDLVSAQQMNLLIDIGRFLFVSLRRTVTSDGETLLYWKVNIYSKRPNKKKTVRDRITLSRKINVGNVTVWEKSYRFWTRMRRDMTRIDYSDILPNSQFEFYFI